MMGWAEKNKMGQVATIFNKKGHVEGIVKIKI